MSRHFSLVIGALQIVMFHTAQWSPDGKQLLVTRMTDNHQTSGYVYDFTRAVLSPVSQAKSEQFQRAWKPARREREVTEQRTAKGQVIGLGTRSRGAYRAVSRETWAEQPSLSPDGRSILYEGRDDPHNVPASWIVVVDTSGSNPRRLYRGTDPSWSPDGRRIVFKTDVRGVLHVATIPASGGAATVLTPGVHPAWSPDGRYIAYMVDQGGRSDIWTMKADGSGKRCITCAID